MSADHASRELAGGEWDQILGLRNLQFPFNGAFAQIDVSENRPKVNTELILMEAGAAACTRHWAPEQAKVVQDGKGNALILGVFPEAKEFLVGYCIVDVDSPERASGVGSCRQRLRGVAAVRLGPVHGKKASRRKAS